MYIVQHSVIGIQYILKYIGIYKIHTYSYTHVNLIYCTIIRHIAMFKKKKMSSLSIYLIYNIFLF